jgi:hypothetical protein
VSPVGIRAPVAPSIISTGRSDAASVPDTRTTADSEPSSVGGVVGDGSSAGMHGIYPIAGAGHETLTARA